MLREDGAIWILPTLVILSLPCFGFAVWVGISFNVHYGYTSRLGSLATMGCVAAALVGIAILMAGLMRRRRLRVWHRCLLALFGVFATVFGWVGFQLPGTLGWVGFGTLISGLSMLLSLLQEQMMRSEGEHS